MFKNEFFSIEFKDGNLVYTLNGKEISLELPYFEIDGKLVKPAESLSKLSERELKNKCRELKFISAINEDGLALTALVRVSDKSPVIRFKYILSKEYGVSKLTKSDGKDNIVLTRFKLEKKHFLGVEEIRFADFDYKNHCFHLTETAAFESSDAAMGPMLVWSDLRLGDSCLIAYEHGSQYNDAFLSFYKDGETVSLKTVKGSYYNGREIGSGKTYETVWLEFAAVNDLEIHQYYRKFILNDICEYPASRKPYIFYNTWNYQERNKSLNGREYLAEMNNDRMLSEIDIANKSGVDVFVIDTGWFNMTGDYKVNPERFPDGLKAVREKLKSYGMKLGLWFDPRLAAKASGAFKKYRGCMSTYTEDEAEHKPGTVWEMPDNYIMCLDSDYRDSFADALIWLAKNLDCTYFKWDAVWQYDCNRSGHYHGDRENPLEERRACYSYDLPANMGYIAEKLSEACPEAIIDFDITEWFRTVGLSWLAHGKYFLINNGPFYRSWDIPIPNGTDDNIFFFPGQSRTWFMRDSLVYDKWIPSALFLAHYFPDDPYSSQICNLASLILGHHGIWGDLPKVSEKGISLFNAVLSAYKKVADDCVSAQIKRFGKVASSLEVYERINEKSNRGIVCLFSPMGGRKYTHRVTVPGSKSISVFGSVKLTKLNSDYTIEFTAAEPGEGKGDAAIVIFD